MSPQEDAFCEIHLGAEDKENALAIQGVLLAEISELGGMRTRELEGIKAWVSRRKDKWRSPYARHPQEAPRRTMFIGTTNADTFLRDETGHRRWLPLRVRRVDVAWLQKWRDQLWAEGAILYMAGGVAWEQVMDLSRHQHDAFEAEDPWEEQLARWLTSHPGEIRIRDFLTDHFDGLGISEKKLENRDDQRVGRILRKLGFSPLPRRRDGGVPLRKWAKKR